MTLAIRHFRGGVQTFQDRRAVARNCRFDSVDLRDIQSQPDYQSALPLERPMLAGTAGGDLSVFETTSIL